MLFVCKEGDFGWLFFGYVLYVFRVPYIRDGRCCVVEERFESSERAWFYSPRPAVSNRGPELP